MKPLNEINRELQSLLSENKFNEIFEILDDILLEKGNLRDQFILLKGDFNDLFSNIISGVLTNSDRNVTLAKLRERLLKFINKIKKIDIKIYITKKGEIIDSPLDRTDQIIDELIALSNLKPNGDDKADIWSFSFLSIFAVGENDPLLKSSQPVYLEKLLRERRTLISLLEQGFKMKCIICPASEYSLRTKGEDVRRAISRTQNLITFLDGKEKFLKNIDWAISRYDYENRYIIGNNSMFLGLRYGLEVGYGITYYTKHNDYIEMKKEFYEAQFSDRSDLTLVRFGNKKTHHFRRPELKREAVRNCLSESLDYLKGL